MAQGTRWVAMVLAAIPFLGAVISHAVGHTPQPAAPAPPRPALVFEQYLVDLGEVEPTEEIRAVYRFTNHGSGPVTIGELVPSCGCLNPQLKKLSYDPGESGEFFVRVRTANEQPGLREYTLAVHYDDGEPRETNLTFRVVLPEEQVVVRPRALIFFQWSNQPTKQELLVTDPRANPLDLIGARCTSDSVDVQLGQREVDAEGHVQYRVSVTVPGNVAPGRHQALVTLFTNDPVFRELKVPLIIEGRPGSQAKRQ